MLNTMAIIMMEPTAMIVAGLLIGVVTLVLMLRHYPRWREDFSDFLVPVVAAVTAGIVGSILWMPVLVMGLLVGVIFLVAFMIWHFLLGGKNVNRD